MRETCTLGTRPDIRCASGTNSLLTQTSPPNSWPLPSPFPRLRDKDKPFRNTLELQPLPLLRNQNMGGYPTGFKLTPAGLRLGPYAGHCGPRWDKYLGLALRHSGDRGGLDQDMHDTKTG